VALRPTHLRPQAQAQPQVRPHLRKQPFVMALSGSESAQTTAVA
jgi:hypothetical protein